jgi:nucleoside-diphosphate-sugar epimerase
MPMNDASFLLDPTALPRRIDDVESLEELLSRPSGALVDDLAAVDGEILVLGAGGKMGPNLAQLARRAAPQKRIVAVARFTEPGLRERLERGGVETIACDLLDREAVQRLPRLANIVFMAGRKFGAEGDLPLTWAMNVQVPAIVADSFRRARIIAFSTGCVYPFAEVSTGGSTEETPLDPPGEYALSCVGRERMFEYFSALHGTPGRLFRLNYAIDLRYGVLHDIARKVKTGAPIDLSMGHVNVIWQGDACTQALRLLRHCTTPTSPLNVSGPELLSVRALAEEFAARLGRAARFTGSEAPTAWLTDTRKAQLLFGQPSVPLATMIDWVAAWVAQDRPSFDKPTKFESRNGRY